MRREVMPVVPNLWTCSACVARNRSGISFSSGWRRIWSRGQILSLLRETNFTPASWAEALFYPPSQSRWALRAHQLIERTGRRFWPMFCGVLIVEAQKRLYQGLPVAQRASRRVFVPVLSPQGAARSPTLTEPLP